MSRLGAVPLGLLVFVAVTIVAFGVGDVLAGVTADPGITVALSGQAPSEVQAADPIGYRLFDFVTRSGGLNLVVLGLLMTAILLIPYRAGERWAWAVMWTLPAWAISVPVGYLAFGVTPDQPPPPPMVSGPIVAVLTSVALLVDRGRFAHRRAVASTQGLEAGAVAVR